MLSRAGLLLFPSRVRFQVLIWNKELNKTSKNQRPCLFWECETEEWGRNWFYRARLGQVKDEKSRLREKNTLEKAGQTFVRKSHCSQLLMALVCSSYCPNKETQENFYIQVLGGGAGISCLRLTAGLSLSVESLLLGSPQAGLQELF